MSAIDPTWKAPGVLDETGRSQEDPVQDASPRDKGLRVVGSSPVGQQRWNRQALRSRLRHCKDAVVPLRKEAFVEVDKAVIPVVANV